MRNAFNIITIISGVIMTITILLQQKGSGLGRAFGGDSTSFRSRRGAEKVIFNTTVIMSVVFVMSVMLSILSKS